MDFQGKYNTKSPGVKRLMREAHELKEATEDYHAHPVEDNLFEWHFTVKGAQGTEFEGGLYHGRIILPTEYPMKPPNIILLNPNGRFETNKKICLSISGHHPESWQPSWSIRTALLALIAFMPTPSNGTIGSVDYPTEERQSLARKSKSWECPQCGKLSSILGARTSTTQPVTKEETKLIENVCFKAEDRASDPNPTPRDDGQTRVAPRERVEGGSTGGGGGNQTVEAGHADQPSESSFMDSLSNILVAVIMGVIGFIIYRRMFLLQ